MQKKIQIINTNRSFLLPTAIVFIASTAAGVVLNWLHPSLHIEIAFLVGGNTLLVLLTLVSFYLSKQGLSHAATIVFINKVYTGILIKLLGVIIAFSLYIFIHTSPHLISLLSLVCLYFFYSYLEVSNLVRISKN